MNTFVNSTTILAGGIGLVLLGAGVGFASLGIASGSKVLSQPLAEPLNGATSAKVEISAGSGNLAVDPLASEGTLLASGTLEYPEKQAAPTRTRSWNSGQETFSIQAGSYRQSGFHFPWQACNGLINWQIHLNPAVRMDLTTHSGGGNLNLNLAEMSLSRVAADTGGGNVELVLPANASDLSVNAKTGGGNVTVEVGEGITGSSTILAKSGAGNVTVRVPSGVAVRVQASSGMGKKLMDASLTQVDQSTYQTPGYETAANKIEITVSSGAGNVSVITR